MFSFRAYFWNNDVYINEKYKYAASEILTAYLNIEYISLAEDLRYDLKSLKRKLLFSEDMSYDFCHKYNDNVYSAMRKIRKIDDMLGSLPPFDKLRQYNKITLEDVLNGHTLLFEDGIDHSQDEWPEEDTVSGFGLAERSENGIYHMRLHTFLPEGHTLLFEDGIDHSQDEWPEEDTVSGFGLAERSENGIYHMRLHTFLPEEVDYTDYNMVEIAEEANKDITGYFDSYISLLDSYISVHKIFRPFIENYLHRSSTFPSANEVASYFDALNREHGSAFQRIKCKMESFGYKVLNDENNKPILCEEIHFADLISFLYYDFFSGIKKNYIPNQCKQCSRFFLIRAGKYFSYCDTPLPDEPDKTCRDVGARRRYDDKCKNDPVWQTYNRAYKAHYARYMKKRMTVSEFEQWSRFASELRDKALAEEMPFEQYYADIRK